MTVKWLILKNTNSSYNNKETTQSKNGQKKKKKWAEDLNRHFSKKKKRHRWPIGTWKDVQHCSLFVYLLSPVLLFPIPWTAACQASLPFTISWSLFKFMSIESVMLSNHLIPRQPLLFSPSILTSIRIFPNQEAKALALQLQHQSFQWIFRVDFLQDWLVWSPCSPRDSQESSFSSTIVKHQLTSTQPSLWSNSHICTWLHGLLSAKWLMPLLFNTPSRFVIAFLPRSKCL